MKRFDFRIVLGLLLVFGGGLLLLQTMGFLQDASDLFWGSVFVAAGAAFLVMFVGGQWWAAIPGLVLAGLGATILLPDSLQELGGGLFLGAIGLSFWLIYLTDREKWWAIIPGGVLVTLGAVASSSNFVDGVAGGGIFFLGMSATFLLVALLAGMRWAYWPMGALGILGLLLFIPSEIGIASYVGALALILVGGFLIFRFFRPS